MKTVATIQQIFLHTRSHANVFLYHTVMNAMLANSESHAVSILNMAKLWFHYLQLHRWEASLLQFSSDMILIATAVLHNQYKARWVVDKPTETNFVSQGAVMALWLTHKVSQYHAVIATTPSMPQDVKCSQPSDLFSATARNPQRLSTSHSQYVKTIQTTTVCISTSDLNNLLPVFQQAFLFISDNIHGFQFIILNFTDYSRCPVSRYASKRYGNWQCGYVDQTH
jgi:hypothetical protein